MPKCKIRGCSDPGADVFEVRAGPDGKTLLQEWWVCTFHHRDLELGGSWHEEDDEIVMGAGAPLDVVGFKITDTRGRPRIEFQLGRDGIVEQSVSFRIDRSQIRQICAFAADGDHSDAFSEDDG